MIDIQIVQTLKRNDFEMADILNAIQTTEANGEANLGGWVIRYNDKGEMITVHPSWGGIYVGDYNSHIIFQKNLSYTYDRFGFMSAKYRDLAHVLEKLEEHKTNGFILCECCACDFNRRKKQVEKAGYTVYKTNIDQCKSDIATCVFLIA